MKLGILGGSFNPVHNGHIRMAIEVRERLGLDRVELVPAKQPPHKDSKALLPFELRLELVERAIDGVPGLGANPLEGARPGVSFTCDTLHCYRTEQPDTEFSFILGASTFLELPNWKRGLEIPALVSLVVVNRWEAAGEVADFIRTHWPGADRDEENLWTFPKGHTVQVVDVPRLDIKGEYIRHWWLERRNLHMLVPTGVIELLEKREAAVEERWGKRA